MGVIQFSQQAKTLLLFNAESTLRKWTRIRTKISIYIASIIAVIETWLADDIVHYYAYSDYHQFSQCRKRGGGGGAMLFFDPYYSELQVSVQLLPPNSCNLLPVVNVTNFRSLLETGLSTTRYICQ